MEAIDLGKERSTLVQGVRVPTFLYGTAWKEERTEALTAAALDAGFRGIDTANQRKHYHEAGVGAAVRAFLATHPRESLFLQTKFTSASGQDHRLPYDPAAPLPEQVRQSFERSLEHLGVAHLDAYVLHGPEARHGLGADDWAVWRAMEALHAEGRARLLGVSNVTAEQLRALLDGAKVPPALVQNRCYAQHGWDASVRALCRAHGLMYEGFSLLTANRSVVGDRRLLPIARRLGVAPEQVIFRFAMHIGILPLTGSTDRDHLRADLSVYALTLTAEEVHLIEALRG